MASLHNIYDTIVYTWPGKLDDSKELGHTVLNIQKDLPNLIFNCEQILFLAEPLFNLFTQSIYATIA